jgi:hypothetical protein
MVRGASGGIHFTGSNVADPERQRRGFFEEQEAR